MNLTPSLPHDTMTLLSSREVGRMLHWTTRTVARKARNGELPAIKIGDDWRFYPSTVEGVMGRPKRYSAPEGLIRRPGSPYWYALEHGKYRSTGTGDINIAQAMQHEREAKRLRGIVGSGVRQGWTANHEVRRHDVLMGISPYPQGAVAVDARRLDLENPALLLFPEVLTRYLAEVSPDKCKHGASDLTCSTMPSVFFKDRPIHEVDAQAVYQYQDWRKSFWSVRKKRPVCGATINREVALIRQVLKKAVRWGYLKRLPIQEGEVEGLHETKRERYITDDEFQHIRSWLGGRNRVVDVLYFTAQRIGKILSLQWRQIDCEHRTITFSSESENKKSAEIVWINDGLLKILQDIREEQKKQALISPWVFCHKDGSRIKSIKRAWGTACKKAKVEDVRIHDIRHKAITDMRRKGISEDMAMLAAGHKTRQMSQHYTHYQVEDIREAFEALSK